MVRARCGNKEADVKRQEEAIASLQKEHDDLAARIRTARTMGLEKAK